MRFLPIDHAEVEFYQFPDFPVSRIRAYPRLRNPVIKRGQQVLILHEIFKLFALHEMMNMWIVELSKSKCCQLLNEAAQPPFNTQNGYPQHALSPGINPKGGLQSQSVSLCWSRPRPSASSI